MSIWPKCLGGDMPTKRPTADTTYSTLYGLAPGLRASSFVWHPTSFDMRARRPLVSPAPGRRMLETEDDRPVHVVDIMNSVRRESSGGGFADRASIRAEVRWREPVRGSAGGQGYGDLARVARVGKHAVGRIEGEHGSRCTRT